MARTSACDRPSASDPESGPEVAVLASDPLTLRRIAGLLEGGGWSVLPCERPDASAKAILICVDLGARKSGELLRSIREDAPGAGPGAGKSGGLLRPTREDAPGAALVAVSPPASGSDIRRALRAGADSVVFEAQLDTTLAPAVVAACAGMTVVPHGARHHVEK